MQKELFNAIASESEKELVEWLPEKLENDLLKNLGIILAQKIHEDQDDAKA